RVADDSDDRIWHLAPPLAVQVARAHHAFQFALDGDDALVEHAPVELDLRLARTAEESAPAALAFEMGPRPHQAALLVGEVRQLYLQPAFPRLRAPPEDLEDQPGAVEHLGVPCLFEVALLHGADGVVDDDETCLRRLDARAKLIHLAGAE